MCIRDRFYGVVFAATGLLIHAVFADNYWLLAGLTTGFLLLGPFLAMGLYDLSRRMELGEAPKFVPSLTAWRPNLTNIGPVSYTHLDVYKRQITTSRPKSSANCWWQVRVKPRLPGSKRNSAAAVRLRRSLHLPCNKKLCASWALLPAAPCVLHNNCTKALT